MGNRILSDWTSEKLEEAYQELCSYGSSLCDDDKDYKQELKAELCRRGWR